MNNVFFTSGDNYMKRDPSTGSASLAAPVTSAYSGSLFVTNFTVTHNLGFVPMFRVYMEPFKDGTIWPPLTSRLVGESVNPLNTSGAAGPGIIAWPTSTTLQIQIFYFSNTLTGTYPVYWVIYQDYTV
jgi:hypothetical protein